MSHPELYFYNTKTKRHILKESDGAKRIIKKDPGSLVESVPIVTALIAARPDNRQLPPPAAAPIPETKTVIGPPMPEVPPAIINIQPDENADWRQEIKRAIQQELRASPESYAGKSADELSSLFRTMLIERLAPAKKSEAKGSKKQPAPVKSKFKLRPPPPSSDEDSDSEDED